ncbi:MAG: DUF4399 domain-containing protein [Pseudomonadales bacterium]|nr:DUF4399 domain-containing protein [Gammaproteobacteria bacterium]NNL57422.1 DUF4399 domain-containing protein [Pseudomonadales bacterium]
MNNYFCRSGLWPCLLGLVPVLLSCLVSAQQPLVPASIAPADARAYILSPVAGEVVPQTFKVVFGLSGMGVAPAGVPRDNTGHHHILIDLDELPDLSKPLPSSAQVKHFGGGQTETWLTLAPGEHSLQLLLGNHLHLPHSPPVLSEKIRITVK